MGLYSFDVRCLRYCKSTIFQANHNRNANRFEQISLFAILQKYDFSSKSQHIVCNVHAAFVVCDTAKVRFFKQITTQGMNGYPKGSCLRYCKSTIFQANHNTIESNYSAIRRINHYWLSRSYINRHIQIWVKNVILNLFATMLRL